MRRLVVLTWLPVGRTTLRKLHVQELRSAGADVSIFDASAACFPGLRPFEDQTSERVERFADFPSLIRRINDEARGGSVFLPGFPPTYETIPIFRALSACKAVTWALASGYLPFRITNRRKLAELGRNIADWPYVSRRLKNLYLRAARSIGWARPPDVAFCAGSAAVAASGAAQERVGFNHFDLEDFAAVRDKPRHESAPTRPYAVFLDNNLTGHQDFKILGIPTLEPAAYYRSLRGFFGRVEGALGLEVVVAAHPKTDTAVLDVGGRRIFKHRTGELVRHSSLVLSHNSASVSFAVLGLKPILFLHSSQLRDIHRHFYWPTIQAFAEELGQPLADIDQPPPPTPPPNPALYDAYKYRYLATPDSEGRRNRDILLERL